MYQGPIGAIVTPQLKGYAQAGSLPFASTLCGACYEVCPVKIDIPKVLVHLRGKSTQARVAGHALDGEALAMKTALWMFGGNGRMAAAQALGRVGQKMLAHDGVISRLPGPLSGWTNARDFPLIPKESFRDWWKARHK
jgi:L-lactate dehydrogenase complex protein LldF